MSAKTLYISYSMGHIIIIGLSSYDIADGVIYSIVKRSS